MTAVRVWLGRHIHVPDAGTGYFVRAAELPITPFPGLGVTLKRGTDPTDVKFVYVNWAGAVVAEVEEAVYDERDFDADDQKASQFAWETDGWVETPNLGPGSAYSLPPPTDADLAASKLFKGD